MKVVTFGELMVRLQPYNYERFVQASTLEFTFGGGEANVAVSLANYGVDAAFVTKLPAHAIGQCAVNSLRRYGVDTSMIVRGGDRVGIYYNEKGASQRGSVCIYDRANSAIQLALRLRLGEDLRGRRLVPLHRHHPGSGRERRRDLPPGLQGCQGPRRQDQLRPELPRQAVDP